MFENFYSRKAKLKDPMINQGIYITSVPKFEPFLIDRNLTNQMLLTNLVGHYQEYSLGRKDV